MAGNAITGAGGGIEDFSHFFVSIVAGGSLIVRQGSFVAVEDNDGTDYEVTGTALVAKIEVDRGSIVVAGGPFASFAHLSNPIDLLTSPSYPYSGSGGVPAKLWASESFIAIRRNILRRVSAEQRIAVVEMDAKRNVTILGNTNSGGEILLYRAVGLVSMWRVTA